MKLNIQDLKTDIWTQQGITSLIPSDDDEESKVTEYWVSGLPTIKSELVVTRNPGPAAPELRLKGPLRASLQKVQPEWFFAIFLIGLWPQEAAKRNRNLGAAAQAWSSTMGLSQP